jgi:hypothetical protein
VQHKIPHITISWNSHFELCDWDWKHIYKVGVNNPHGWIKKKLGNLVYVRHI